MGWSLATNVYTSDYSLAAVRRKGLLPTNGRLAETDLLGLLNDATQDYIVPLLVGPREGYLSVTEHTAFSANQDEYELPPRAVSERLVRVSLVSATTTAPEDEYQLTRIEASRLSSGQEGFELTDNTITLRNAPTGYSYLRIVYFRMPNRLVALEDCCKVTAVGATTVTVDDIPSTFSTSEPLDFIAGTPGFRWRAIDKTPTNVDQGTNILTFTSGDIPSTLAVGDYVALAGETPIAQVPVTLRSLLEQQTVCLALEALGDSRLAASQKTRDGMEKRLAPTLQPRVTGSPRVIVGRVTGGGQRVLPRNFR